MANRRLIVKRRRAVRNIRKITRTMQLIATARFQKAFNRATASKPYTEKLAELVADLAAVAEDVKHPLLETRDDADRSALVVLTSARGLCGGYNANVLRTAISHIKDQEAAGKSVDVTMVGKKGINYFKFLKRPMVQMLTGISDKPRFEDAELIANELMARFTKGEIASAHVAYMQFVSVGSQQPKVLQLLPLKQDALQEQDEEQGRTVPDFEFSPEPQELLNELLPATVRAELFQCFTDAAVSEQIARMVAMKAATDAAGDMIKSLTRQYNRARQTSITMELLDIVGGANALE